MQTIIIYIREKVCNNASHDEGGAQAPAFNKTRAWAHLPKVLLQKGDQSARGIVVNVFEYRNSRIRVFSGSALASALLFLSFLSLSLRIVAQPSAAMDDSLMPVEVDRMTQQWLDLERQTSHLRASWTEQQPILKQQRALLKAEKAQLQSVLKQSSTSEGDVEKRRAELMAEQTQLEQAQVQLGQALSLLSSQLQDMAAQLPPVLQAAWQAEQGDLALAGSSDNAHSEHLQRSLAQLNLLADFDQRVTVHEGVLDGEDEKPILVKQLFLGLGMAWFVSRDGETAGWGQADEHGWNWHFDEGIEGDAITAAIAMYEKRQSADLLSLPIYLSTFSPAFLPAPSSDKASIQLSSEKGGVL